MTATPWLVLGWLCTGLGVVVLAGSWLAGTGRLRLGATSTATTSTATTTPTGRNPQGLALAGTVVLAVGVLALVSGLLLDSGDGASDSLRTGGLAAASVVALYGLWLNDRRRRVDEDQLRITTERKALDDDRYRLEESRQELDRQRADHERVRAADDRFAKALELLGHSADQVRVGAMHALAALARSRPGYAQTTLDILCAYLRRPYDHPSYAIRRNPAEADHLQDLEADRERQVRLTAQRLVIDLLPAADDADGPTYNLDLTGAALEYFDLSHRKVGTFTARSASFYEAASFEGARFHGPIWLTFAHLRGDALRASDMVCHGIAWWSNFTATGPVEFDRTEFRGETKFAYARFAGKVSFLGCRFAMSPDFRNTEFASGVINPNL